MGLWIPPPSHLLPHPWVNLTPGCFFLLPCSPTPVSFPLQNFLVLSFSLPLPGVFPPGKAATGVSQSGSFLAPNQSGSMERFFLAGTACFTLTSPSRHCIPRSTFRFQLTGTFYTRESHAWSNEKMDLSFWTCLRPLSPSPRIWGKPPLQELRHLPAGSIVDPSVNQSAQSLHHHLPKSHLTSLPSPPSFLGVPLFKSKWSS